MGAFTKTYLDKRNLVIDIIGLVFILSLGVWTWNKIDMPVSQPPDIAERWSYYSFSDDLTMLAGKRFHEEGFVRNYFLANSTTGHKEFARGWYYYQFPQVAPNSATHYTHHGSTDAIINGILRHAGLSQYTDFYKVAALFGLIALIFWYAMTLQLFGRLVALISMVFIGTSYVYTRLMETIAYYSYDPFWAFGSMFLFILANRSHSDRKWSKTLLFLGAWLFTFLQARSSLEWIMFLQIFFWGYYSYLLL